MKNDKQRTPTDEAIKNVKKSGVDWDKMLRFLEKQLKIKQKQIRPKKMNTAITYTQFITLCNEHSVEPNIAIEDGCVSDALALNDLEGLKQALKDNF